MNIHALFSDDYEAPGPGWAKCDHPWCGLLKRTDVPCPLAAHHDSMEEERRFNARRGARRMLLHEGGEVTRRLRSMYRNDQNPTQLTSPIPEGP